VLEKIDTRSGLIDVYLGLVADEEYNPGQPNDYEKIMQKKSRLVKEMEGRIEKEKLRLRHIENMRVASTVQANLDEMDLTPEEAYLARLRRSQANNNQSDYSEATQSAGGISSGNKIKKMMEAMGWKGKGLGKQE
jgi:hypothetical protein